MGAEAAAAAAGMIGPLVQGAFTLGGTALQYKYNKELAALQNQYNIDMWKMQADYNSPQNQMKRFEEAGLNPNLIYGQGSNGNMSSAPQLVAPQAPDAQRAAEKLAQAFNIQNLILNSEKIKEAHAQAKIANIQAENAFDEREAVHDFQNLYSFDPNTGSWVFTPGDVTSEREASPLMRRLKRYTGSWGNRQYYFEKLRESQYRNLHLIPYRAALMEYQKNYLAPQIQMLNYQQKYYPFTFWIDNVNRGTGAMKNLFSVPFPW